MSVSDSEFEEKEKEWKRKVIEMRERRKVCLDENMVEGKRINKLYHGMKLVSSITMMGKFKEICYCEETQEYLIIDSSPNVLRYSVEGKIIQPAYPLNATMIFTKLLWCQRAKVLIGYLPNDDVIWLMTSFCMLYQVFRNDFRITAIFYEPDTNEAVVAGSNKVTRFQLSNKESTINPSKTISYIDSEYGTLWKLECLSIIPSSTFLRIAGSYMSTLYVLPLEMSKEREEAGAVMFLARNPGATEASITAILFEIVSQWIITGDEQGNVMGWDLELHCTMSCHGGHNRCIRQIVPHPSICGFVTCAEDNVLQIWSCNLRGKMESFSDVGEIWGIAVNESAGTIATIGQKLNCFNMHQLYTFYAVLSDSATQIISTTNPMYSTRVIVRSSDNSIRILTSPTGKQINLQILPKTLDLVSMAYSGNRERLYTIILKTGEILISDTTMNPTKFKHVWLPGRSVITCITAYEYYEEVRGSDLKSQNPRVIYPKYTLIFVGTKDGAIVNVDESSGEYRGKFMAHNGAVTKLCSSTMSRIVVSVGIDKCVKVWRVYADLALPLALAYSVYYTVPISHVVTMGLIICMVSSTPRTSVHQLFMYDTVETVRLDHHPSKDHTELVTGIAASQLLQICATSSMDNTIRVWDQQNLPIKVLEINTCANTIAFSSLRGDIVFGAGKHLYRISYRNYLGPKYRTRILMNEIPEEMEEETLPENKEYRIYEDEVDRELLLHPVSSVPFGSLDMRNENAPRLELMIQQQICAQLQRSDQDISNIKKGEIKAVKLVSEKSLMNHDVWEKYIGDISETLNRPRIEIPPYDVWTMMKKYRNIKKCYNKSGIFRMFYGCNIEKFAEDPDAVPDSVQHPDISLFGFLPNSIIYKLFSEEDVEPPPPQPEQKPLLKYEYPEEFLMDQRRGTDSSRFDSKIEISPSQLMNMTQIKDIDSDTIVVRAAISEDQSPFIRMARYANQYRQNYSKMKKHRVQTMHCSGIKRKKISKAKTVKRKHEVPDTGIPLIKEKIISRDEEKIKMFSKKVANFSSNEQSYQNISHAKVSTSKEFGALQNRKREGKSSLLLPHGNLGVQKYARLEGIKKTRQGGPKCASKSNMILNKTSNRILCQKFTNIDDLDRMRLKDIISQKKRIKQTLDTDYGSVSIVHDRKIRDALISLLTRCINSPSSFKAILSLLSVLSIDHIQIIEFLCTIFTVTSKKMIRKWVIHYLKNHSLRDPQKVLSNQLIVVRNLINTSDFFMVKKFISGMISEWMNTLGSHVALVAENSSRSNNFNCVKNFQKKETLYSPMNNFQTNEIHSIYHDFSCVESKGFPDKLVISPIEGINYFCKLNTEFFKKS